ncbi:MAG: permease-like cell division protein FtsX [Patescibacteria group bacterium]|nr:permease-like cell division protein FtsX [Patescibacteria group bacterium]
MVLGRLIKEGWELFKRKKIITFVLIFISFLMSFLILVGLSVFYFSNELVDFLKTKLDFSVYFKDNTSREDIVKLKNILENFNGVEEVVLISKESAFEDFQRKYIANPIIIKSLVELNINPLVDYLIIRAKQPEVYNEIAKYLETSPYRAIIDFLTYSENKNVIERFIKVSNQFKFIILIFLILIFIFTFLIILNLTLLTIYSQKDDIEVFRLIGAPNYFIRLPFVIFNLISSFLGFLIAEFAFVFFLIRTRDFWKQLITTLNPELFFYHNFLTINLSILFFLFLINIFATMTAMSKYLKI